MAVSDVLVSLPPESGTAAVVRLDDERGEFLVFSLERACGGRIEGHIPMILGTGDDGTVQAGRMPAGAERAVVIPPSGREIEATVGSGFYVVSIAGSHHATQPVRFTDAEGTLVRAPASTKKLRPIADARDPCPACGAVEWEGGDRVAACGRCGHEVSLGTWYGFPSSRFAWPLARLSGRWHRTRMRLDRPPPADFPVYAVAGSAPSFAGQGWGGDARSVKLAAEDRGVVVETERGALAWRGPERRAREELAHVLFDMDALPRDASDEARSLWMNARRREGTAQAERARARTETIPVAGEAVNFTVVAAGGRWAAFAELDSLATILIRGEGDGPAGIELVVADPVPEPDW